MNKFDINILDSWIRFKEGSHGPDAITKRVRELINGTDVKWREKWGNRAEIRRQKNCPW